jgi:hypothetical protein
MRVCVCVCVCVCVHCNVFVWTVCLKLRRFVQEPHLERRHCDLICTSNHVDDHATTLGISIFRVFHDHPYRCFPNVLA